MTGIKLSKRLGAIASLISPCDTFTDVGTDHALLPLWLVSNGICSLAIASDINSGPLEKAKMNAYSMGIGDDRIRFILSDGLQDIEAPVTGKNTLSICGMGGLLIAGIMEDSKDRIRKYDTLILSPHTKQYELRHYLTDNGFVITDEKYICEDDRLYVIIKASPATSSVTGSDYTESGYRFGQFIKNALKDDEVKYKLTDELKALEKLIAGNSLLPEDRRKALIKEALCYREVLGIEIKGYNRHTE